MRKRGSDKLNRRMSRANRRSRDHKLRIEFSRGRATTPFHLGPNKEIPWRNGEEAGRITY